MTPRTDRPRRIVFLVATPRSLEAIRAARAELQRALAADAVTPVQEGQR